MSPTAPPTRKSWRPSSLADVLSSIGPVGSRNPAAGTFQSLSASTIGGFRGRRAAAGPGPLRRLHDRGPLLAGRGPSQASGHRNRHPAAATFTSVSATAIDSTTAVPIVAGGVNFKRHKGADPQSLAAALAKPPRPPSARPRPTPPTFHAHRGWRARAQHPLPMSAGGTSIGTYAKGDLIASTGNAMTRVPVGLPESCSGGQHRRGRRLLGRLHEQHLGHAPAAGAVRHQRAGARHHEHGCGADPGQHANRLLLKPPPIGVSASDLNANNLTVQRSLALPSALAPSKGGTGLTSIATSSLLLGNASGTLSTQSVGSSGQFLQSDPTSNTGVA